MSSDFPSPKHKTRFDSANLAFSDSASWASRILTRWKWFLHWRGLQKLERLNDRALRDIGVLREPGSRQEEWWKTNPPP